MLSGKLSAKALTPATRLIVGSLLFLLISLLSLQWWTVGVVLVLLALWLRFTRFSGRALGRTLLAGVILFAPLVLYGWLTGTPWRAAAIGGRGVVCLLTSVSTCAAIGAHEARAAVAWLPAPVARLIVQLVLQSGVLAREARSITNALRLRGGTLRVLFAFPTVWLTRLLLKAERVSDAMEVRGVE